MRKILISILCVFIGFSNVAVGENILTTQSFVDSAVAQKQDKIPANNGATQVLMNTGTDGSVGTKNIYDSTGAYATQTDALVTAGDFNTAVQNAIDMEFTCIEYDAAGECLLVDIQSHANLLGTPTYKLQADFDTKTHIMTNTVADTRATLNLDVFTVDSTSITSSSPFNQLLGVLLYAGQSKTLTFSSSDYQYLYIKHNGIENDNRLFWTIEPHTTYTLTANVLSANPRVVGGIRILLSLQRANYLPAGN